MSYISTGFVVFNLILLVLYYIVPAKYKAGERNLRLFGKDVCLKYNTGALVLLIGSLFFYCTFDLKYVVFLLFVALSTYLCALSIGRKKRKGIFILCIAANVTLWFAEKTLAWTIPTFNKKLLFVGLDIKQPVLKLLEPIGISFFVLQAVAYLADVYKGKCQAERNFAHYLLFISYFPAIVQGPISRYNDLMPKLLNNRPFSTEQMRRGLTLVLFGLVKKVVIADRIGIFVDNCFAGYESLSGIMLFLGAVGYSIQLYTDFSGCVDICRGVSNMYNVELMQNFNRPYLATSVKDFWARWHISLSSWLKDYIYIPLGGNRKGVFRKYVNLMITFLVSGLWHGADFKFICWGALHAVYQITGQATEGLHNKIKLLIGVKKYSLSERVYQTVITFLLITFAWVFFRAPSLSVGWDYIMRIFSAGGTGNLFNGSLYNLGISQNNIIALIINIVALIAVEMSTRDQNYAVETLVGTHFFIRLTIYLLLIFDVILFGAYGSAYDISSFIYGGF